MTDTGLDLDVAPTRDGHIKRHTPEDFEGMRKAGQLSARALDMLVEYVKPGVTTQQLDDLVREFYLDHGAAPATIFYRGYIKSSCTSINHVVCHGIPNNKPLRDGDIVNIDVTCMLDGWHGDTSRMFGVGDVKRKASSRSNRAIISAISAPPFRNTPRPSAIQLCAISAAMASADCFMTRRMFCILANTAQAR